MRIASPGPVLVAAAIHLPAAFFATARGEGADALVLDDKAPVADPPRLCDWFDRNTLYEGGGLVRRVVHHGRYQGQFVDTADDHPAGGDAEFWEHRRWRAGLGIELAGRLSLVNNFSLDTTKHFDGDRFVDSLWDLYLRWDPAEDVYFAAGKIQAKVTREWTVPSTKQLTFERSAIVDNVISLPLWGALAGFEALGRAHEIGIFGTAYETGFHGPSFEDAGLSLTYRVSHPLTETSRLFLDCQYADGETGPGFDETFAAGPYRHVFALGTESKRDRFGLLTDLIAGCDRRDFTLDDTWGLVILPSFDLSERLQAVLKYSYSEDLRIDRPQRHASRPLVDGFNSLYLGLNCRICGDHLKLMAGYEYTAAGRIVGTETPYRNQSWLVGVRTYW